MRCSFCNAEVNEYNDTKSIVFCDFYCIGNFMKDCMLAKEQDAELDAKCSEGQG